MIIPEDGCLPPITRTNLTPFNNVMIVKFPQNLKENSKLIYNLVPLDSSKKGEQCSAANNCKETTESIKESSVSEVIRNIANSTNKRKIKADVMNKPVPSRRKVVKKRRRKVNNKPKLVKKNIYAETKKYCDVPASEINPWLPTTTLIPTNMLPLVDNQPTNFCKAPLLDGNGSNDLINDVSIVSTVQDRLPKNITSTNLPISQCHGSKEMPPVKVYSDHSNFRSKLISEKNVNLFADSCRDNASDLFPYNRICSSAERDTSSNNTHFQNRSETLVRNSYDSNYVQNADLIFRNGPYENYDVIHVAGYSAQSHRKNPPICQPGPPNGSFMRTETVFPGEVLNGNVTNYRNIHPQKFARNSSSEAFEGTSGGYYGGDVSYSSYNEMPRNNFSEVQVFQNNFRNNCGDEQKKHLNENSYIRTHRDYNRNHKGSQDSYKPYETYKEMHTDNANEFYGQHEDERRWDNNYEPNPSFNSNYRKNKRTFYKRNKSFPCRKGSFRNAGRSARARIKKSHNY